MTESCTVRAHLKCSIKMTLLQEKHGQMQSHNFCLMAMRAVGFKKHTRNCIDGFIPKGLGIATLDLSLTQSDFPGQSTRRGRGNRKIKSRECMFIKLKL